MARQRRLLSDPRYREALRAQQRLRAGEAAARRCIRTARALTPEQADAVIDLVIERQISWQLGAGLSDAMTEEAVRQRQGQNGSGRAAYQAKLRELLGEANSRAIADTTWTAADPPCRSTDSGRNSSGADPLRDDQVEPLIAAMHAEQAQMQKELQEYRRVR